MSQDKAQQRRQEREVECSCLANCSHFVQHGLESIFGNIGRIIGTYPWITIFVSVIGTCAFGAGFLNWTTESRTNKLWIPQNTEAEAQSEWVSDVFGFETRTEQILLRPNDNGNVLTAKYIEQYWIAHYLMVNETSPAAEGFEDEFPGLYSWDGYQGSNSVCLRLGTTCDMETILDIVGYSAQSISNLTDEDVLDLVNDPVITARMDLSSIIGGLQRDNNGRIISGAVLAGTYKVEAKTIDVNNQFEDPSREEWELEVAQKILDYNFKDCEVVPYFQEAFSAEFGAAIGADGMAYGIGCGLLIFYTTIALGKRDYVHSMMGLALCAIITVGLAVLGSYGLAGALSIIYTPLSTSLPFLVLGLGVDDAFIIAGEFQQQIKDHILKGDKELSAAKLMEHTMKHAGVSILITSVTDVVAFGIGATTVLPALRAFCLFAAFGVFFVFLLNVTFFAACVVVDHQRAISNRPDCCCCCRLKTPHPMFPELLVNVSTGDGTDNNEDKTRLSCCCCLHKIPTEVSRKLFKWIGEQIANVWVKVIILAIALGGLGFSIYGAFQLKQEFKIEWFIPDSSYLQDYYAWKEEFFQTGTPIFIYSKDIDYLSAKQELLECNYLLRNASYLDGSAYDWHLAFWRYVDNNNIPVTSDNYYDVLQGYLRGAGGQYNGLIEWKNSSQPQEGIVGAFMIGEYKESAVIDAESQVDAMYDIRDDMEDIVGDNSNIFGFTFQMLFWEQYAVIAAEFYRNLILAICVVFGIALILIPKISAALLVLLTVIMTIVDVLGFMWLWGLTIDAVTVCYTVIAIGLAVDYSAHVGEAFMLSPKNTKSEKVIDSLYRIGSSVFNGAFSTFLAVVAMANSQTYIFRVFFRQFFLVTLIGSIHGLIVLPVLLSWFGPNSTIIVQQNETEENNKKKIEKKTNNDNNNNNQIKEKEIIITDTEYRTDDNERTNVVEMNKVTENEGDNSNSNNNEERTTLSSITKDDVDEAFDDDEP